MVFFLLALGLSSFSVAQVTTGRLVGSVVHETGGVLPGASVSLSSPLLMGGTTRQTVSEKGQFRFLGLAPGFYDLEVEHSGFRSHREGGIRVEVGATIERRVALSLTMSVDLKVVADRGQLDRRRGGEVTHFGSDYLENVPVARLGPYDLLRSAPGMSVSKALSGPTIVEISAFGSGTNENLFVLDGTDYTDPEFGGPGAVPNLEVIEEIEIIATGGSAEYGNYQGAVFNLVSRQGGNEFRGGASFYTQPPSLASQPIEIPCFCPAEESGYLREAYYDLAAQLGGPLRRDRAWFFGTFRYLLDASNQPGGDPRSASRLEVVPVLFGKVNWRTTPKLRFFHSLHLDDFSNRAASTPRTPFETGVTFDGTWFAATLADMTYFASASTLVDARVSLVGGPTDRIPNNGDFTTPARIDLPFFTRLQGVQTVGSRDRTRLGFQGKASHFAADFLGADHDFKFGVQFQHASGNRSYGHPGGVNYFSYFGEPYFAIFRDPWAYGGETDNLGLFAEDVVQLTARITLSLGARFDRTVVGSPEVEAPDGTRLPGRGTLYTWSVLSPRLGFAADLTGDGLTVLRGSWGRYRPGVLVSDTWLSHPGRTVARRFDYDPLAGAYSIPRFRVTVPVVVDPETRPSRTDPFSLGLERELSGGWSAGLSYVGKRGADFLGWRDTGGLYGEETLELPDGRLLEVFPLRNDPDERVHFLSDREDYFLRYDALVSTLTKRFSSRFRAFVSYTWARGEGNQLSNGAGPGLSQSSSTWGFIGRGQDPNDETNGVGNVQNDRRHSLRAQATALVPRLELAVGANFQLVTGFPYGARTFVPLPQGGRTILVEPPGTRRLESQTLLDLRLSRSFRLGDAGRLEILADFLNLLDEAAAEQLVDTNLASPFFELGSLFVDPRRVMLAVKVSF